MNLFSKQHFFSFFDAIISEPQYVVVGVSGGPDSMLLLWLLQEYYSENGRDAGYIVVAHFNHGQRAESIQEKAFLQTYCKYNLFYWNTIIPPKGLNETKLRILRHEFFGDVFADIRKSTHHKTDQPAYLFLGHNISDRIETSILNMIRGAGTQGISSIKPQNKTTGYTIVRPLIELDKPQIQDICDKYSIPYFLDATNNHDITPRNTLRNKIFPLLYSLFQNKSAGESNRYKSRRHLYREIDENKQQYLWTPKIKELAPPMARRATTWYEVKYMLSNRQYGKRVSQDVKESQWMTMFSDDYSTKYPGGKGGKMMTEGQFFFDVVKSLKPLIVSLLSSSTHITQKQITSVMNFLISEDIGYFYVGGRYFFKTNTHTPPLSTNKEQTLHCIQAPKKFWEKRQTTKKGDLFCKKLIHTGLLQFDGNMYSIQENWIGGELRYGKPGDVYKGKKLAKVFINKKIPLFLRNTTPVIARGNNIIEILF